MMFLLDVAVVGQLLIPTACWLVPVLGPALHVLELASAERTATS